MPSIDGITHKYAFSEFSQGKTLAAPVMDDFWNKYNKYLNSDHWKGLRADIILARGRRCELTGILLLKKETHVHHWIYRPNFKDAQPEDLSVLGEIPHQVIHHWIKTGEIDRTAPDRLEQSRKLYAEWLKRKFVKGKSNKFFKRLNKWLLEKGVITKSSFQKKKRKRKLNKAFINRGRGFDRPEKKWSVISEKDRQDMAIERNQGF